MSPARHDEIVPKALHDCILSWIVEYADIELSLIPGPASLEPDGHRVLFMSWPFYWFLIRALYGIPSKQASAVALERAEDVIGTVAFIFKQRVIQSDLPKDRVDRIVSDLEHYERLAVALAAKPKEGPQGSSSNPALLAGTHLLLLQTTTRVLMRRAIIAQKRAEDPVVNHEALHLLLCKTLDYKNCPLPEEWESSVEGWLQAYKSRRLHKRVKKMLSDDLKELKSYISPHVQLPPKSRKLPRQR